MLLPAATKSYGNMTLNDRSKSQQSQSHPGPHLSWRSSRRSELGVASLPSSSTTHKLTFDPTSCTWHWGALSIYLPQRFIAELFFPDSWAYQQHVALSSEDPNPERLNFIWLKPRKLKTNEQKYNTTNKHRSWKYLLVCILPHKQTLETGFLPFCKQTTKEHNFRKYMPLKNITSSSLQ